MTKIILSCECVHGKMEKRKILTNVKNEEQLFICQPFMYFFWFSGDWQNNNTCQSPVCVCVCVIFPYVMHHIDATRNSHHGAYIIVCAYIIYGIWVRSYVWSFLLLVLRITSAHINLHGAEILRRFLIWTMHTEHKHLWWCQWETIKSTSTS